MIKYPEELLNEISAFKASCGLSDEQDMAVEQLAKACFWMGRESIREEIS